MKSLGLASVFLVCTGFATNAQPVYPLYAYGPPQATAPQPWYYNPYTSGLGPCPQRRGGIDPPCRETMEPSYGQPSFWPRP